MPSESPESIAQRARSLQDESERLAYLDRACRGDEQLRAEVDRLLASATQGLEMFFPYDPAAEKAGDAIGRYVLVQELGHGGFGTVWMADQQEPVRRRVALKVLNLGMDTRQVVARFEQERQALALMDHPNVARVLDAGVTATGRPYFVMDLVKGVPIGQYCDGNKLTIDERLRLFAQVCDAVQHAHGKGIIHRDLKPSNVLVGGQEGKPHATVIDFGIAKATSQRLTEKTLQTAEHQVVGTLLYMSPEQAEGSVDIDTRTDVYSLGVVLYELLTGSTPFGDGAVRQAVFAEIQRLIREVDPPKPSSRITQSDDTLPGVAAARNTEPGRLGSIVRGDLDWIVMKAMDKDRSRRYETASSLALDIAAYLKGEAVRAAPPSAAYRLRKFVRRNRVVVAAAAAVLVALLIGVIGFAWQAAIARGQRDRAKLAEDRANERAGELQKVSDFQNKTLREIDVAAAGVSLMADLRARHEAALVKSNVPEDGRAARNAAFERELPVVNTIDVAVGLIDRTVLLPAVRAIDAEFGAQPLVDASLRTSLGMVYRQLGRPAEALALHVRALELRVVALGEEDMWTLESRAAVGRCLGELQRLPEAESALSAALEGLERVVGHDHDMTLNVKSLLAELMLLEGNYERCEAMRRDVLERRRRLQGPDHSQTLSAARSLGAALTAAGRYAEAEAVLRGVVDTCRRTEPSIVGDALGSLGSVLTRSSRQAAAEPYLREALELRRQADGEDHPDTVSAMNNLTTALMDLGKLAEAEPLAREALEKVRRMKGDEHAETLKMLNVVGQVLFRQGRAKETEPYYREALETGRRVLGEDHPDVIVWISNMGSLLKSLGRLDEAEPYLREAADKFRSQLGAAHPYRLTAVRNLADLLELRGMLGEAADLMRSALDDVRGVETLDSRAKLSLTRHRARFLRAQGNRAEAETCLREALGDQAVGQGEPTVELAQAMSLMGNVLCDLRKFAEAESWLQKALEATRRVSGDDHPDTLLTILRLATLCDAQGRHADVIALLTPIEDKVESVFGEKGFGVLRRASLVGLLGTARAGLARTPEEYAEAEGKLLEAYGIFVRVRGESYVEARQWAGALSDFYAARHQAAPGEGYDAKSAEWKARSGADAASRPASAASKPVAESRK